MNTLDIIRGDTRPISVHFSDKSTDPAPVLDDTDKTENVRYQRLLDYPAYGDVIDALFKKEAGDATEWNAIRDKRAAIKIKYPKI